MSNQPYVVLKNKEHQVVRVTPLREETLYCIYREDLKRIEFCNSDTLKDLKEQDIEFEKIETITTASKKSKKIASGPWGEVHLSDFPDAPIRDIEVEEDKDPKNFYFFLKWTAAAQTSALVLLFAVGWFFQKPPAPETAIVTVFQQEISTPPPVTTVVQKPVQKIRETQRVRASVQLPKKVSVKNRAAVARNRNSYSGHNLYEMGALAALGGMNKNSSGRGGLSQAPSSSQGYGFDSARAAGGHHRSLLGKGLIQGGVGQGETMQGYGGLGTQGKGSGQAAYGAVGMAGRSGGYYLPLSENPFVEGGLDRDQVNAVVERNKGQVIFCYEKGLQSQPRLHGRVAVQFVISPTGQVTTASVSKTSLDSKTVESCIVNKLRGWRFPKPKGNVAVKVNYPFVLQRLNQG